MTQDLRGMAEMAGGMAEFQADPVHVAETHGIDAAEVIAAELAAESQWTPSNGHHVLNPILAGLAGLEAETEQ